MLPMALVPANSLANDRLNGLLIDVGRSLLQYTSESWPWAAADEEQTRHALERMAAQQRDVVLALAELLADRGHAVDFGTYPTGYTSLHYVAVDYLLDQLVANQAAVLRECEAVASATFREDDARSLLDDVVLSERQHLDELRQLASDRP